ncbi:hypothetical protein BSIN_3578 [Burkholderia singularis]|uniref:Uncharacterized protein n=1 Tax=Burkholderia singularis TaxID=1503053 RepID=A0A238H5E7_9BURK|nr:hypothetical protein BSIN_3578 [Burkholderia singularis]
MLAPLEFFHHLVEQRHGRSFRSFIRCRARTKPARQRHDQATWEEVCFLCHSSAVFAACRRRRANREQRAGMTQSSTRVCLAGCGLR